MPLGLHVKTLIDCYGNDLLAYLIAAEGVIVFLQYVRISRTWGRAARSYGAVWHDNPWIYMIWIFLLCGSVHNADFTALFWPNLAVAIKFCSRLLIFLTTQFFLSRARTLVFHTMAQEAILGRSAYEIAQQMRSGEITQSDLIDRIAEKVDALELAYNQKYHHASGTGAQRRRSA